MAWPGPGKRYPVAMVHVPAEGSSVGILDVEILDIFVAMVLLREHAL